MKTIRRIFVASVLLFTVSISRPAQAFTVYDPVNAALNTLRNALMQSEHIEKVMIFLDQLRQIKSTYEEMLRVNFGMDDIIRLAAGDLSGVGSYLFELSDTRVFNLGYEMREPIRALVRIVEGESTENPRTSYEAVFGKDPLSNVRPDLTYQDIRALNALRLSAEMMKEAKKTKETGRMISESAQTASPKGAARLTADALGKLLITNAGTHEALARLIELQVNELSRQAMEEKYAEAARLKFIQDFEDFVKRLEGNRWES